MFNFIKLAVHQLVYVRDQIAAECNRQRNLQHDKIYRRQQIRGI
jgi:hypothetical protein